MIKILPFKDQGNLQIGFFKHLNKYNGLRDAITIGNDGRH